MRKILIIFLILQFADILMTYLIVINHGIDMELNPIVKFLMLNLGVASGLILPKLITICGGYFLCYHKRIKIMIFVNIFYLLVICFGAFWITFHFYWSG